jgi:sulfate transport system permease protein
VRVLLILGALGLLSLLLLIPLGAVFVRGFEKGAAAWRAALVEPDARAAIRLTLLAAAVAVPINTGYGLAVAWLVTRFRFAGKNALVTLVDLPFSVSPVIAGMLFVLLFGSQGWFGPWLQAHDLKILFAVPGIILATVFVTSPLVARELLPLMQSQGSTEEEAALTLGATGWQMFRRVTLPKIRWALLFGVVLCNARAMGEFGAVSVVSGHIRGETNTLPLHIEILYNEYQFQAAFAAASLLTLLALVTLVVKAWVERHE